MQQEWKTWRDQKRVEVQTFQDWLDRYTAADHDATGLFAYWRQFPNRQQVLRRTLDGQIVPIGNGPQLLLALFYALFQIANGKTAVVATAFQTDTIYLKTLLQKLSQLGQITIKVLGPQLGCSPFTLTDLANVDLAVVDYFQLIQEYHNEPERFRQQVQSLFLLEADLILYTMRLIVTSQRRVRAAGMLYKTSQKTPDVLPNKDAYLDVTAELDAIDTLRLAGSTSYADAFTAAELKALMPRKMTGKLTPKTATGYTAMTYRTSLERSSALVSDIIRTPGNALVVCNSDELRKEIAEELRKSGQDATLTSKTTDVLTFFTASDALKDRKKVCIFKNMPSTITAAELKQCPGALYVAEHFLTPGMHQKLFAFAEQLFTQTHEPRLYVALEDQLFTIYDDKGAFGKLFNLIDFTEKYDPWKQIRRVLAKSMIRKLHRLRTQALDDQAPLITAVIDLASNGDAKRTKTGKVTSKLDAPCFCGSGKPFRECHGKLKKLP